MKSVISAAVIFIFIIVTSFASNWYINRKTDEMLQFLYKNEIFVAKNQWEEAENETKKLQEKWQKYRGGISVFINHSFTSEMDEAVDELKNAVKIRVKGDCFYSLDYVKLVLLNFKEQQKITVQNIF